MSTFVLQGTGTAPQHRLDYAKELNQEQLDVVLHGDGPCLVLAGAGSGKTRTLTYRVAYLLERGVDPSSILLLTFTNKAAREMLSRVSSLAGYDAQGIWGGTFHSIASRMLRSFAETLGYQPNFSILDAEDARDLIKAVMKDLHIDPKARRFPSGAVVMDVISYARNAQRPIGEVLEWKHPHFQQFVGEVEEIARQYQLRKKTANVMDFDDLLSNLVLLLEDERTSRVITAPFQYLLVDEYQDTNAIQARLVKGFAKAHGNILVVGDDAQSIYAFRGADVKNILAFPKEWVGAKIFKLVTNYRSTPQILELANASLANNREQFQKELVGLKANGDKPKFVPCASVSQEAQYVAEQILVLRQEGKALRQMAVLFRSSAHSQALEFELLKRDIPYEYRGGQKFFERAHIKDVISFLRVAENVHDEVAWLRVLGLQQGIGAASAAAITRQAKMCTDLGQALSGLLPIPARAQKGWQDFLQVAGRLEQEGRLPAAMIRAICDSTYQDYLEREYPNWRERLEDLEQLAVFAEGYEQLGRFLADISLYDDVVASREQAAAQKDEERMVLSTIHQAKGLEWDTVFIIHLADNAFPNRRAMAEEGGMEEERRLFYVAVTRARQHLFLTYPLTMGHDTLMFNQPSTFVEEVSPRLLERVEVRQAGVSGRIPQRADGWNWDGQEDGYEEPTVELDRTGERRSSTVTSTSVWKGSNAGQGKQKPTSFLREIDEL